MTTKENRTCKARKQPHLSHNTGMGQPVAALYPQCQMPGKKMTTFSLKASGVTQPRIDPGSNTPKFDAMPSV